MSRVFSICVGKGACTTSSAGSLTASHFSLRQALSARAHDRRLRCRSPSKDGQRSLAYLLLRSGYRLELERYAPLDMALEARRWDFVDLLVEWGADLRSADVYTVLNTYNVELYERLRALGYDLTERHEMAAVLGQGTSNRPLLGLTKRHRAEDAKIQRELDIALGYHVRAGNERGINLWLWAGADPHAPAPNPELGLSEDDDPEDGEERWLWPFEGRGRTGSSRSFCTENGGP
jgi:hypothetical protein